MSQYPEHEKIKEREIEYRFILEFIQWIEQERGVCLASTSGSTPRKLHKEEVMILVHKYFDVYTVALEKEQMHMQAQRKKHKRELKRKT